MDAVRTLKYGKCRLMNKFYYLKRGMFITKTNTRKA